MQANLSLSLLKPRKIVFVSFCSARMDSSFARDVKCSTTSLNFNPAGATGVSFFSLLATGFFWDDSVPFLAIDSR